MATWRVLCCSWHVVFIVFLNMKSWACLKHCQLTMSTKGIAIYLKINATLRKHPKSTINFFSITSMSNHVQVVLTDVHSKEKHRKLLLIIGNTGQNYETRAPLDKCHDQISPAAVISLVSWNTFSNGLNIFLMIYADLFIDAVAIQSKVMGVWF